MSKITSVLISIIYLVGAYIIGGMEASLRTLGFLVLPLACIWFSDGMGGFTGFTRGLRYIDKESPACVVGFMGLVLLLMPLLIIAFTSINRI